MPSLLPSVAAAAGEILGELRQRFMSSLPAGGRACEAETGKSHNGQDCQVARLPGCHRRLPSANAFGFNKIIIVNEH